MNAAPCGRAGSVTAACVLGLLLFPVVDSHGIARATASNPRTLYSVRFTRGPVGWKAFGGAWPVKNGILTCSGTHRTLFLAPYRVHGRQYAVEATIRLLHFRGLGIYAPNSFGLLFRANTSASRHGYPSGMGAGAFETVSQSGQKYTAAIITNANDPRVDNARFNFDQYDPSTAWHRYRLTVDGNALALAIDGKDTVNTNYAEYAGATRVGLFSTTSQIEVRSFTIFSR